MTATMDSAVAFAEIIPSVLLVQLKRPVERNPLSIATLTELSTSLSRWLAQDSIDAIIFTGVDDVFASGANIHELARLDITTARQFSQLGQTLLNSIAGARAKTIAAINGYCIGGGLDLALACDIRIASSKARFAHPGARLGIITGWGGTQRLPRLIGKPRALELFATASTITAEQALRIGLIDRLADPLLQAALQLAAARQ
ncbi:MAG TPA: enoyl-CoA hydratase/isomerase family protein [Pyrinomonadaceae bacterium]|nr:enoyl-CoA hydratase/isomerase family protein [Pyrinomonadaceae bacterium]